MTPDDRNDWGFPVKLAREESRIALAVQWGCIFLAGFVFGGSALACIVRFCLGR